MEELLSRCPRWVLPGRGRPALCAVSGGLDSTLALIVMAHAFDDLNLPRSGILAVTMPGFGTTSRTRGNAEKLAEAYGVELRTVSISKAVEQHFADIGQNMDDHDVTYENSQARERTQVLMDMGWNGGNYEMNIMINNALQFGLSDEFTGATLKDFIERYVRLGLITSMDDTDEILNLAWTPVL